jgi:hypothetical protein
MSIARLAVRLGDMHRCAMPSMHSTRAYMHMHM